MTRYRDVSVVRHVQRIHRVVDMTYVQPVIHVNEVTRVHHHTIVHTRNSYQAVTGQMRPIWSVSHAFHDDYDCGCGH